MSQVLTANQICERALRAIGAFPVTDPTADGEQVREAMFWLDLNMAQLAGSTRLFFFVQQQLSIVLTNGTTSYNLNNALGANLPIDGVQFPIEAWLQWPANDRKPLPIVTRDIFNSTSNPAETGLPRMIYIDRLPVPTLQIFPTPSVSDANVYTVLLDVQTYAPNVAPAGVTGTQPSGTALTKFRQAWQRYLIAQLSHDLGSGPIFKLPESSLNRFGKMASSARTELEAFENREHDDLPPIGEPAFGGFDDHDFDHDRVRRV